MNTFYAYIHKTGTIINNYAKSFPNEKYSQTRNNVNGGFEH